jgi:hypothetical protein
MLRDVAGIATVIAAVMCGRLLIAGAQQVGGASTEIAIVANAEEGTHALVDVGARAILGKIDVNPERAKSEGPGAPNFAQDTDVSPDGRTLYVSRGYLGDVVSKSVFRDGRSTRAMGSYRAKRPRRVAQPAASICRRAKSTSRLFRALPKERLCVRGSTFKGGK